MNLNPAQQRVLDAFLSGRLPAGQLHAQLRRASALSAPPPPLPHDTASIPVPVARAA
jgi:hypothetical protein